MKSVIAVLLLLFIQIGASKASTDVAATYYVQAGAFRIRGDAEALADRLVKRNLPAQVSVSAGGVYRVRLGPYVDRDVAVRIRREAFNEGLIDDGAAIVNAAVGSRSSPSSTNEQDSSTQKPSVPETTARSSAAFCALGGRYAGVMWGIHVSDMDEACRVALRTTSSMSAQGYENGRFLIAQEAEPQTIKCPNGGWFAVATSRWQRGWGLTCGARTRTEAERGALQFCNSQSKECRLFVSALNEGLICGKRPAQPAGPNALTSLRAMGTQLMVYNEDGTGALQDC